MASITFFALLALIAGIVVAYKISRKNPDKSALNLIGSAFVLGVGLTFTAGMTHSLCEHLLKICASTTDTTVFNVSFPLMAIPVYWLVMLFSRRAVEEENNR